MSASAGAQHPGDCLDDNLWPVQDVFCGGTDADVAPLGEGEIPTPVLKLRLPIGVVRAAVAFDHEPPIDDHVHSPDVPDAHLQFDMPAERSHH